MDRRKSAVPGAVHFVGIGGAGMSALAQFHVLDGGSATGSDRLLDRGEIPELRARLTALGVRLFPQDGSGVGPGTERLVASTAIENDSPEFAAAKRRGLKIEHRADRLAGIAAKHRTIAVAGTNGKSTVAAMIYEILAAAGEKPSLITGAPLLSLRSERLLGNAALGGSDVLVIEADESDGTLTRYFPWIGVLLSLGRDHKEVSELRRLFAEFRARAENFVVAADPDNLAEFRKGARTFGFRSGGLRGADLESGGKGSRFTAGGVSFELSLPGRYNACNALAAAAAAEAAGVPLQTAAEALRGFGGVARRFESLGDAGGVEVVDDYAHNPDKVRAVLGAARERAKRLRVLFQPHGYGPARFLKNDLIAAFAESLGADDILWMPEIYYVGGTTTKDISSRDITDAVKARGKDARFTAERAAIVEEIVRETRKGDLVLVLGARDPGLSLFAAEVLKALAGVRA